MDFNKTCLGKSKQVRTMQLNYLNYPSLSMCTTFAMALNLYTWFPERVVLFVIQHNGLL
jgi:hypothetical protein